jgi:NitT/TauT family transport system permease protein
MQLQSAKKWLTGTWTGKALTAVLAAFLWVLVWHVAAMRMGKPLLLPAPVTVLERLLELIITTDFWRTTLRSLLRVLGGIASGVGMAVIVSALTAAFRPLEMLLSPLITVIKSTPVASFIILAMLWIGDNTLPIFISFLMVFPVIWANLHTALSSVPSEYRELAKVYRLPLLRRIRRIYAPHALPHFLSACRSSMGLAWKAGIAAEAIALPAVSIGRQLMESKIYLETTDLFAWTSIVIVLSLILETAATRLFRLWQTTDERAHTHGKEAAV